MSEKDSFSPKVVEISVEPFSKKASRKEVRIMVIGLNLASHATMIAVNPLPPAVSLEIV